MRIEKLVATGIVTLGVATAAWAAITGKNGWTATTVIVDRSGSMWKARSIHHSFSSHTSPGLTCQVRSTVWPCCSANTLNTGWRKPIHRPLWVS